MYPKHKERGTWLIKYLRRYITVSFVVLIGLLLGYHLKNTPRDVLMDFLSEQVFKVIPQDFEKEVEAVMMQMESQNPPILKIEDLRIDEENIIETEIPLQDIPLAIDTFKEDDEQEMVQAVQVAPIQDSRYAIGVVESQAEGFIEGIKQVLSQEMSQRINQQVNPGLSQDIGQHMNQGTSQEMVQQTNQGISQEMVQQTNQGISQEMVQQTNQGTSQEMGQQVSRQMSKKTNEQSVAVPPQEQVSDSSEEEHIIIPIHGAYNIRITPDLLDKIETVAGNKEINPLKMMTQYMSSLDIKERLQLMHLTLQKVQAIDIEEVLEVISDGISEADERYLQSTIEKNFTVEEIDYLCNQYAMNDDIVQSVAKGK